MIHLFLTWILASGVEEKGGLGGRGESPPFMADLRGPFSIQTKRIRIKHVRCKTYRFETHRQSKPICLYTV